MEPTKEVKIALIQNEITGLKQQEYQAVIRGQVAAKIGNQGVVDANQKTLENIAKMIPIYEGMIKELDGSAGK